MNIEKRIKLAQQVFGSVEPGEPEELVADLLDYIDFLEQCVIAARYYEFANDELRDEVREEYNTEIESEERFRDDGENSQSN